MTKLSAPLSGSPKLTFAGNAYFRGYWQHHLDGSNTSAQFCDPVLRSFFALMSGSTVLAHAPD